jgi:uncharacterized membrane protein YcaP (DUF421 family)
MILRALVVYLVMVAMLRLGQRRMMSRNSPFDLVLAIIVGSVASRAVTGNAPLVATLAAAAALVAVHWAAAAVAFRFHRVGYLLKGEPRVVVRDGRLERDAMRRSHITERDLEQELRRAGVARLEDVGIAILERDGRIAVISKETLERVGPAASAPVLRAGETKSASSPPDPDPPSGRS